MQIQLKQTEIVAALKQYIQAQGINLQGKSVDISFTAGRKESGVVADISINDVDIPGFTDEDEKKAPELKVVGSDPKPELKADSAETPEPVVATASVAPAEKATSLFS